MSKNKEWHWFNDNDTHVLLEDSELIPRIVLTCNNIDPQDRDIIEKSHNLLVEIEKFLSQQVNEKECVSERLAAIGGLYIHSKIKDILK